MEMLTQTRMRLRPELCCSLFFLLCISSPLKCSGAQTTAGTDDCGAPPKWMTAMQQHGIKAVDAEGTFVWDHGVRKVSIENLAYFSAYSGMGARIKDTSPDYDTFSRMLSEAARPVLIKEIETALPPRLQKI